MQVCTASTTAHGGEMISVFVVTTTVENKIDAEKLTELLFEKKLIGCAQVSSPVSSYYRWEGKMVSSSEYLLSVKTLESKVAAVTSLIEEHHPYDLPEITGIRLDMVKPEYAEWIKGELK